MSKISSYFTFSFLFGLMLIASCSCSKKSTINTTENPDENNLSKDKISIQDSLKSDSTEYYLNQLDAEVQQTNPESFTHKIVKLPNNTYGYYIYANGRPMIYQDVIPAMATPLGFKNEEDAEKVAKLMEEKLRKGISPHAISMAELRALGIAK